MNRQIKFRAWSNSEKRMAEVYAIQFIGYPIAAASHVSVVNKDKSNYENWSDFILLEYTGLKDKNGKEIYKGDILTHPSAYYIEGGISKPYIHIVEFSEDVRCDGAERSTTMYYCYGWIFDEDPEEMEIIGNIYENSDLLK
jgi:uncharacterized phage protein (TIGR01671 family)